MLQAFKTYLTTGDCAANDERLPLSAIGGKEDASYVLSVTDGSFTAPNKRQTLVAFVAGECGRPGFHADNWGKHLTLLLENGALVASFSDEDAPVELVTRRLIPGGADQVLALSVTTGAGGSEQRISVRSYADAKVRILGAFVVADEACSFGATKRNESITRYRWNPTESELCFQQKQLEEPCQ